MTDDAPASQTLSRGIRVLEILAAADGHRTLGELAEALGVHRSIVYRLVRTLEDHRLVRRDNAGEVHLAAGLASLAHAVSRDLQSAALPELTQVADELGMTAFLAVLDHDEVVTIASVQPGRRWAAVAQRPGSRHALAVGAPGMAVQALLPPARVAVLTGAPERPEAAAVRERGWSVSHGEVIAGLWAVAAPLDVPGPPPATLAVVSIEEVDAEHAGPRLVRAAAGVVARLG